MRTTVQIDDKLLEELKRRAQQEGTTFVRFVNSVLRRGLDLPATPIASGDKPFRQQTYSMGKPKVPLDKALSLAAILDDEVAIKKLTANRETD